MQVTMQHAERLTLAEMREFLTTSETLSFAAAGRKQIYGLVEGVLRAQKYLGLSRKDKGIVRRCLVKISGLSVAQITRLIATSGFSGYGASADMSDAVRRMRPDGVRPSPVYEPTPYVNTTLKMFEHLRSKIGYDVEVLHDVHERTSPAQALQLAKLLEPYRLFFLEDPFGPEDVGWFKIMRQLTSTALAMGELFVSRNEWLPLVAERLIDFVRCHISAGGGLNTARKIASCCEFFNVRTAWHGPGNMSAVGHAVNMHLDLATTNFGTQEQNYFSRARGVPRRTGTSC